MNPTKFHLHLGKFVLILTKFWWASGLHRNSPIIMQLNLVGVWLGEDQRTNTIMHDASCSKGIGLRLSIIKFFVLNSELNWDNICIAVKESMKTRFQ